MTQQPTVIQFNGDKADYSSPAYLARVKKNEDQYKALMECAKPRPERMGVRATNPYFHE